MGARCCGGSTFVLTGVAAVVVVETVDSLNSGVVVVVVVDDDVGSGRVIPSVDITLEEERYSRRSFPSL